MNVVQTKINQSKCSQNVGSKTVCLNSKCTNYAFTCEEKNCQCRKAHQFCFMIETQTMLNNFFSKVITNQMLLKIINEQFKKIYDQISKCKNKILNDIAAYFQFYGLSDNQKIVMKLFNSGKASEITGSQIWAACMGVEQKKVNALDSLVQKLNEKLAKYQKVTGMFFENFSKNMKDFYNKKETPIVSSAKVGSQEVKAKKKIENVESQEDYDRRYVKTRRDNANNNDGRTGQRIETNHPSRQITNRRQEGRYHEKGFNKRQEKRDDRRVDNWRQERKDKAPRRIYDDC